MPTGGYDNETCYPYSQESLEVGRQGRIATLDTGPVGCYEELYESQANSQEPQEDKKSQH